VYLKQKRMGGSVIDFYAWKPAGNLGRWGLRCVRADGVVIPPTFYQPPHISTFELHSMSRNDIAIATVSPATEEFLKKVSHRYPSPTAMGGLYLHML